MKTELDAIAEFINGGAWNQSEYSGDGVKVVRVTDIKNETVDFTDCKYLPKSALQKYAKNVLRAGDLVICTVGSHPTQPASVVGRSAVMPDTAHGALLNQNAVCIRSASPNVDQKWLGYLGRSEGFRNYIIGCARGSASQVRMAIGLLKKMPLDLPPLPEQQRIAGILSAYDELIENSQRRIKILEAMARGLYREWFVLFRYPGHENHPHMASTLGDIPQGWERTVFAQAAVFENGDRGKNYPSGSDFVEEGIPFINAGHLVDGAVDLAGMNYILDEKFRQLRGGKIRKGDLLFCLRGSPGRTARTAGLCHGAIASSLVIIRPTERANEAFLYYTLAGEVGKRMAAELNNGAAQPNVAVGSVQKYPLLLPCMRLLNEFAKSIEQIWKHVGILRDQVSNLRRTRDLLMPRLLSGQISVDPKEAIR